jgi:hypothetical protein
MPSRRNENAPLHERLAEWADEVRQKANQLPPGPERAALLKKAEQATTAMQLDQWATSPGASTAE